MGTTADKLNKLLATKAGIKAAIIEKGQPVSDSDTFASYEGKIRAIRTSDIQLAEIVLTKQPTKTSYTAKETFNPAGMEVKAIFSNDAAKFVDDFTVEPSGALKPTDTKATVKYTEFGVTAEADVAITVAAIQLSVPAASGTPVYTGSAITPAWTGYDSSLMDISGDTSGTNAGSYTAVFSLKDKVNYTWADGTTADKSVAWSIGKAQASITLDKSSVVLNGDKLTETVNISSVGMTSIMAMSSDMSVATVSLDGNVLTISSVNETTGEATIVINGTVDSNYNAPTYPSIAVSAEFTKFRAIVDFGAVTTEETPETGSGLYFKAITVSPAPTGWDTCTHVAVDGEVYEVTWAETTINMIRTGAYTPVSDCKLKTILCMGLVSCNLKFTEPGTYTVQLGVVLKTINFNTVPNGTLTTTSDGAVGSTVTLTPTPDEGYIYGGATVTYTLDGVEQTITLDANTTTFTMPAADVTVTPVWSQKPAIPVITTSSGGYFSTYEGYARINFVDVDGKTWGVGPTGYTIDAEATAAAGAPVYVNTFEIPVGAVITCYVESEDSKVTARIKVNGSTVASKSDGKATYDYTVTGSASIILTTKNSGGYGVGTIEITEQ